LEASETAPEGRDPRSRHDRIDRTLRRARKLAGAAFEENPERVQLMLDEARILATLEVADALRGSQDDGVP
jgi:hypothetical protein